MGKPVVHFEIGCRDTPKTEAFYSKLFDWSIKGSTIDTGVPGGIGGHITSLGHEPYRYTMFYVEVEDLAAYLLKAVELGGKVVVPPIPLPTGKFAWFSDPEGNIVGLLEPHPKAR